MRSEAHRLAFMGPPSLGTTRDRRLRSMPIRFRQWTLTIRVGGEAVVPSSWKSIGLGDVDGTVFYRLNVWVPEHWVGKDLVVELGLIDDIDETLWDGHLIGSRVRHDVPRIYVVPGNLVTQGRHVITVANTDQQGAGGFYSKRGDLRLYVRDAPDDMIPLAGPWRWKQVSVVVAIRSKYSHGCKQCHDRTI